MSSKIFSLDTQFNRLLKSINLNESTLRDSYDAVFHLVTAAKGAKEFYTLANNQARMENIQEAIQKDSKTLNCWNGHPHLRIIDNSTDFDSKLNRLLTEISLFLGEPVPFEIERKFLISMPDISILENHSNISKIEIIQTYLKSGANEEVRVRQRGNRGSYSYTKTTKQSISGMKRIEKEERINESEYLNLLMSADTNKRQIRKTRHCLVWQNQYFEIDIYPYWKDKAIMEIELTHEDQEIHFPDFIEFIKDVTDDENYKNSNLANLNNPLIDNFQ